ncbi:MAG TPA: hypothetical protein PLL01_08930 [Rhodoferax sp.]|nr:hypothetical protein [Rhodoferax sp.]
MSLRDALKAAVARCTPLPMQHATLAANDATGDATPVQHPPANPHGIRAARATDSATGLQPAMDRDATGTAGALTAHRLTGDLLNAAMRVCDRHNDNDTARDEMRQQCLALPPHLQADLLQHFEGTS